MTQHPLSDAMNLSIKLLKRRRTYNAFVSNESIEDYSLRSAAKSFRRWPCWLLANTALGGITFLALEAIGALLVLDYGYLNSTLAILCASVIFIATGLPISYYASRYNVDVDLLTRGAGFGYFGSTVTSLIYASYTIIYFAIEAAIMAKALEVGLRIPLPIGYIICSVVIIPLVFYGITLINKLQLYTQPIWIILSVLLFAYILGHDPGAMTAWRAYAGLGGAAGDFDPLLFGCALSVVVSLVPQIGEQADYLRFLPDKTRENRVSWWVSMAAAGPGWIILGGIKMLCGSFLAVLLVRKASVGLNDALEPFNLYLNAFESMLGPSGLALAVTTFFVVVCQVKINVTNAYAGSLAWSNFFSRITHSHPGRAVWLIFNVTISVLLMQFGVVYILNSVLLVYGMFAVAWVGAIFADLVILKPLGISPPHIEYKRANLYSINPVGFGAMLISAGAALLGHLGVFGAYPKVFAPLVALGVSIPAAVTIALLTNGKYYLARPPQAEPAQSDELITCTTCGMQYEANDTVFCPAYDEHVCSLCCSLDSICNGFCKKSSGGRTWRSGVFSFTGGTLKPRYLSRRAKIFCSHFFNIICALGLVFALCYAYSALSSTTPPRLSDVFLSLFLFSMLIIGIWVWWFSLIQETRLRAEDELDKHIHELKVEVTRREAVSAALEETSGQQKLILETASIGIAYVKEDRLVWCNNRFMWLCGREMQEPYADVPLDAFLDKAGIRPEIMDEVQRILGSGGRFTTELPIARSASRQYWHILSISAINPASVRQGSIWLLDDISERKLAEEKLRRSEERLKELNENLEEEVRTRTEELKRSFESIRQADKMASLGILVAGVAHEVNNPTSFIRMNIGMLEEVWNGLLPMLDRESDAGELTIAGMPFSYARESIPKLLQGIHQGADRVSAIITNLKDYARQSPLDMGGKVDINKALDAALELLSNPLNKATSRLEVVKTAGLPCFRGDLRRIEQVLVNLIQNAYQALVKRSQGIWIRTYQDNGTVCFEIRDQGQGIAQEHLQNVCDPFFTTKRDQGGTGFGLSVSAGIIEEHGGTMEISSVLGEGTCVRLAFTVQHPPLANVTQAEQRHETEHLS